MELWRAILIHFLPVAPALFVIYYLLRVIRQMQEALRRLDRRVNSLELWIRNSMQNEKDKN